MPIANAGWRCVGAFGGVRGAAYRGAGALALGGALGAAFFGAAGAALFDVAGALFVVDGAAVFGSTNDVASSGKKTHSLESQSSWRSMLCSSTVGGGSWPPAEAEAEAALFFSASAMSGAATPGCR